MFNSDRIKSDVFALILLGGLVFWTLALLSYDASDPPSGIVFPPRLVPVNLCGTAGASAAYFAVQWLGAGVWLVMGAVVSWDLRLFARESVRGTAATMSGILLLAVSGCALLHLLSPGLQAGSLWGSGGYLGAASGAFLTHYFSPVGVTILAVSLFLAGLVLSPVLDLLFPLLKLSTDSAVVIAKAGGQMAGRVPSRQRSKTPPGRDMAVESPALAVSRVSLSEDSGASALSENEPEHMESAVIGLFTGDGEPATESAEAESEANAAPEESPPVVEETREIRINAPQKFTVHFPEAEPAGGTPEYSLPPMSLLDEPEDFPYEELARKARIAADTLERAFAEFGLNVRVTEIDTGPVVTQFELELEKGLRLNKVTALEDDLAIALRVPSVRVVAPIPGRNTVGVEVPNDKQIMVRLAELLQISASDTDKMHLPLFLGKDVSGRPLAVDLARMPHLLIAGRTGTGKSVCLNTLILSLLMTRTPDDVRMLMIDPKMVELSPYKSIPHLMHPVITDMKKAEAVLSWAVDKMEERYDLLAKVGVRHLDAFNDLGRERVLERLGLEDGDPEAEVIPEKMPFIVVIADEMADLMMTSGKDVEACIIRLAQKSRAVGIHLVLATQKPTVDVITGLIKSNLPARISFQVASKMDSRVVLDESGSERLLGSGDMLYLAPATSHLTRAQGTYVSDDEINAVINSFADVAPEFSEDLMRLTSQAGRGNASGTEAGARQNDDLYDSAVEVVIREGRGSVSLLQRALGIGYGRAARMIDYMAQDGVVGEYNGANAREVVCTMEDWYQLKAGRGE